MWFKVSPFLQNYEHLMFNVSQHINCMFFFTIIYLIKSWDIHVAQ